MRDDLVGFAEDDVVRCSSCGKIIEEGEGRYLGPNGCLCLKCYSGPRTERLWAGEGPGKEAPLGQ